MAHNVETMAYAHEVPWHGLGYKVDADLTPKAMLKAAKLDWTVSKQQLYLPDSVGGGKVPGKYALMRDSDRSVLSVVGSTWEPVQNADAFEFFTKFTKHGGMTMETAGSLCGGQFVWGLAKINADFVVGKSSGSHTDAMQNYLLMSTPHIHGKSMTIQYTSVRVVCWNTLTYALGHNLKGSATAFKMSHAATFDDAVKARAERALGLATEQAGLMKEAAALLSSKRAKADEVLSYFCEVMSVDQSKLKDHGGDKRMPIMIPKFQEAMVMAPGHDTKAAEGTWWGAFNAVTYVADHGHGTNRNTALRGAWYGVTAGMKRKALDLALARAA